jgi:hypothetical protein
MADVPGVTLYRGKIMSRPRDIAGDQLRAVVERIENIENESRSSPKPRRKFISKPREMVSTSRLFAR